MTVQEKYKVIQVMKKLGYRILVSAHPRCIALGIGLSCVEEYVHSEELTDTVFMLQKQNCQIFCTPCTKHLQYFLKSNWKEWNES